MFDSVSHSLLNNACEHPCGARSSALCPPGALALSSVSFFLKVTFLSPCRSLSCPTPLPPPVTVLCQPLHCDRLHLKPHNNFSNNLLCMQVLARSSPTDKFNLVKLLKKQGEIVAVTGMLFWWWTSNGCQQTNLWHTNRHQNTKTKCENGSTVDGFVPV